MRPSFDPRDHIRQLDDGRDYLDLKWRLLWLRSQEPDATVETQVVPAGDDDVVCRATISLRSGGNATAHGSAPRSSGERAVEDAENRALSRALAALGFGAEYAEDDLVELPPAHEPPVNLMTARALLDRVRTEGEADDEPEPEPEPEPDAAPDRGASEPASRYTADDEQPDATDISWTKFWAWARARGYRSADELGELLGVDVIAHTPGEIRRLIKRYELEHPPGE